MRSSRGRRSSKRRRGRVPYTTPGVRRVPVPVFAAAVLLVIALGAAFTAARVRRMAPIVEERPPFRYRIVYAITQDGTTQKQTLTVRRPYDARNETTSKDSPRPAGIVTTAGRAWRVEPSGETVLVAEKAASTPAGDARPMLALPRALREGLAKRAGSGRVAGRACQRFAVAEPLGRPLSPPGPITRTELCVDRRGLVLEERWTRGGQTARVRRAVGVTIDPPIAKDVFLENVDSPPQGGVQHLRALTDSDLRVHSITAPAGFTPDRTDLSKTNEGRTLVDAWVRGPDMLLVEQSEAPAQPWTGTAFGRKVDIGSGQSGELVIDLVASQLRIDLGGGRWLRVSGSVSPDTLVAVARSLRPA